MDLTVRPGSQLESYISGCCCHYSVSCSLLAKMKKAWSVLNGKSLPSEALCKNKHGLDVKPWAARASWEVYSVRSTSCSPPNWFTFLPPHKKLRSQVVTFYPTGSNCKHRELYLEYISGIWTVIFLIATSTALTASDKAFPWEWTQVTVEKGYILSTCNLLSAYSDGGSHAKWNRSYLVFT